MTLVSLFLFFFFTLSVKADSIPEEPSAEAEEPVVYSPPQISDVFFYETFAEGLKWTVSEDEKFTGEWKVGKIEGSTGLDNEQGLVALSKAKHHGISLAFDSPLTFDEDVVIQYEVRLHEGLQCGGAYIKLLDTRAEVQPDGEAFSGLTYGNDSPYIIMFGPDKCGDNNKVHFIFRHLNPVTGEYEEKHLVNPPKIKADKKTHLYTLIIRTDNTYEILIDQLTAQSGSLLEDFEPPVNPPTEIDDPEDTKPEDWVDNEQMEDPEASKPDDWDEDAPRQIVDESASMPEGWLEEGPVSIVDPESLQPDDWDEEDDGEWEPAMITNPVCEEIGCGPWSPPMLANPEYKGKWVHPLIPNPDYKGEWFPRQIPNPAFFVDNNPHILTPIGGVGIEIWTMQDNIEFDDFFVGHSISKAEEFADATFAVKQDAEQTLEDQQSGSAGLVTDIIDFVNENTVAVAVTICAGFVLIVFVITLGGGQPAAPIVEPVIEEEKKEDKGEEKVAASTPNVETEEGEGEQAAQSEKGQEEEDNID